MADSLQPGDVFAGHRIEAVAGRGGMGVVYKATHLALDHAVALKVISPQLAQDERFRRNYRSSFSRLNSVPDQRSPKLVVFHTLLPHDPYIFGARGQSVTFPSTSDEVIHSRLGMKYYLPQLRYVEGRLLHSVDTIRRRSKDAVIVIQADEGFESGDKTFDEATALDIRVKGLLALSLPGVRGVRAPKPPNTVNTLRYVYNRLFGTHYSMLPSTSAPDGDYPYQWEKLHVR